ncbi:MAG: hypothetical protein J5I52_11680 [Saprospiraceae bacterium]|nr:hypothetical protein [Saprospiraceae bacterium]MCZ2338430.1 hypothetical protein [Chitinophagales bacterium]
MPSRKCKLCKSLFNGRTDKIFCSPSCKASYHQKLRKVTLSATEPIDTILHRNRSILLEIMGKSATQKKVPRILLDAKKFNWKYITAYHINSHQKIVHYVYDFSWMIFSDQEVLIRRLHS